MRLSQPAFSGTLGLPGVIFHLAIVAGVPPSAAAQRDAWQATHYTVEDGLAQNMVNAVVQDRAGFIWVATVRGLQRFDGYSFVPHAALDPASPSALSGEIRALLLDRRGRLWVATPRAIIRVDPTSRSSDQVPMQRFLAAWAPDSLGRLWFLDGGTLKVTGTDGDSLIVGTIGGENAFEDCQALATSRDGALWLVRIRGKHAIPMRYIPASGGVESYRTESIRLPGSLRQDATGRIWLTGGDGLEVLHPGAGRFRAVEGFQRKLTVGVEPDRKGGLLVATDDWLVRIDSTGRVSERWAPPEVFGVGTLPRHLALDREGGIWISTTTSGVFRLDTRRPIFEHRASRSRLPLPLASDFVMAILETSDSTLWVGTLRGGAYRVAGDWSRVEAFRHVPRDTASLASDEVWDFAEDRHGNLWVGTTRGPCKALSRGFRCYPVPGPGLADIATDSEGWFWLALGPEGVTSFDPLTGRFGEAVAGLYLPPHLLGAMSLFVERDSGHLWIASNGALLRATVKGGRVVEPVRVIRGAGETILDLHRDWRGGLWIGTNEGLLQWDSARKTFLPIDLPELRRTTVFSIATDRNKRMWLGTAHGLVWFAPESGSARRYSRRDGFLSGELNRRAALLRRNGSMLFGGILGLTEFDPEVLVGARGSPPIALTRWRKVTADGPVETAMDGVKELRLEPGDRAFTVEFAALSYAPSLGRRYRYRLHGLSADWIETADRVATYGTPRPGRYAFQVQTATGSEGQWSTPGASVAIEVLPPLWGTTWFRALLLLLLAALAWTAHRLRLRQMLATERLRLRISRDLHDELGAGLSSIALLSDAVGAAPALPEVERHELRRIGRSARDMVADLRDIVWAIDPEADRLRDVISRMKDVAAGLLPETRVSFEAPPNELLADRIGMGARRDLLLLYKEILHNIAKHAGATEVRIELLTHRNGLQLTVSDNGVGFAPNGSASGTGLKSVRERAARLGGELDLRSMPGGGTTARLFFRRT